MSFHLYLHPQAVLAINYNFTNWGKSSLSQCAFGSRVFYFHRIIQCLKIQSLPNMSTLNTGSPNVRQAPGGDVKFLCLGRSTWPGLLWPDGNSVPAHSVRSDPPFPAPMGNPALQLTRCQRLLSAASEQHFLTSHFAPSRLLPDNPSVMLWALITRGSHKPS